MSVRKENGTIISSPYINKAKHGKSRSVARGFQTRSGSSWSTGKQVMNNGSFYQFSRTEKYLPH
jgi:hypothetical protein